MVSNDVKPIHFSTSPFAVPLTV